MALRCGASHATPLRLQDLTHVRRVPQPLAVCHPLGGPLERTRAERAPDGTPSLAQAIRPAASSARTRFMKPGSAYLEAPPGRSRCERPGPASGREKPCGQFHGVIQSGQANLIDSSTEILSAIYADCRERVTSDGPHRRHQDQDITSTCRNRHRSVHIQGMHNLCRERSFYPASVLARGAGRRAEVWPCRRRRATGRPPFSHEKERAVVSGRRRRISSPASAWRRPAGSRPSIHRPLQSRPSNRHNDG
jgi:hypothetical protein